MSVPVTAPKLPLINMFICPLLVFIINYVGFPLPFVVQNTAPGIITLYSPPKCNKMQTRCRCNDTHGMLSRTEILFFPLFFPLFSQRNVLQDYRGQ